MTTLRLAAIALFLVGSGIAGDAQSKLPPGQFKVYGSGVASCGTWVTDAKANSLAREQDIAWVLGFLTGAGWNGLQLTQSDLNGISVWMDNYCQTNPLKNVASGAEALAGELSK